MNCRKNVLITAVVILLTTAALMPIARILSFSSSESVQQTQKDEAIIQALEMYDERKMSIVCCEVKPFTSIEEIWAIEDTREEADSALVWSMTADTGEMGFDEQSNTFYCTLGLENESNWPDIQLKAYGEEGVQAVWVDDYNYDWCEDAISQGYRYELLAYTDAQYAYIGVVFTGLPIVTLHANEAIDYDIETPGRMTVSASGYDPVDTAIVAHQRGGNHPKPIDKPSYRVEMHMIGSDGKADRREISLLGMEPDSEWLLLSNAQDTTAVRNKIVYDIWADWYQGEAALMTMDSRLVEVFVGNEYKGIYQLMERVQPEKEITLVGGNPRTDCTVRGISAINLSDKPVWNLLDEGLTFRLEYRYEANNNAKRAFELAEDYVKLSQSNPDKRLDDEEFTKLALERVDIEDMMNYILFYYACTLRDNSSNNIYLYIMREKDGRYVYRHAPWDLDSSLWVPRVAGAENQECPPDMLMVLPNRMLELDVGGCRKIMWDLWNEKRATIFSQEAFSARLRDMESFINASGAYLRESEKHYGIAAELNLSDIEYYTEKWLELLRSTMEWAWPVEGMSLLE